MPVGGSKTIVVADDDFEARDYFESVLRGAGYSVRLAGDGEEVLDYLRDHGGQVSLVLLDVMMPRKGGVETHQEILRLHAGLPVILISSACTLPQLSDYTGYPALFLEKPVGHGDLLQAVKKALGTRQEVVSMNAPPHRGVSLVPRSPRMRQIYSVLQQVGYSDVPVLLEGETGVGKEVLARQLHAHSNRANRPFLKLNCAALPSELVESELFGYQRGAFTGAFKDSPGKFEMGQKGTILLDEIGDMDVRLQAKLLQVLQDGEFQRLGSGETVRVDVRIMAATHRDLRKAIRNGTFREDLFYRLNVIRIRVPSLRERREEIIWLAEHFLEKHATQGTPPIRIGPELAKALVTYDWPGNVRELENLMRSFLVLRREEQIVEEVRTLIKLNEDPDGDQSVIENVKNRAELEVTLDALTKTNWNQKEASRLLKIDYRALLYRMKKLGIDRRQHKVFRSS